MAAHLAREHPPISTGARICTFCRAEGTDAEIDAHIAEKHELTDLESSTEVEFLLTSSH